MSSIGFPMLNPVSSSMQPPMGWAAPTAQTTEATQTASTSSQGHSTTTAQAQKQKSVGLGQGQTQANFEYDQTDKLVVIKIRAADTGKVIQQIPSEQIIRLVASFTKSHGSMSMIDAKG